MKCCPQAHGIEHLSLSWWQCCGEAVRICRCGGLTCLSRLLAGEHWSYIHLCFWLTFAASWLANLESSSPSHASPVMMDQDALKL